jgi:hypothetical protein
VTGDVVYCYNPVGATRASWYVAYQYVVQVWWIPGLPGRYGCTAGGRHGVPMIHVGEHDVVQWGGIGMYQGVKGVCLGLHAVQGQGCVCIVKI